MCYNVNMKKAKKSKKRVVLITGASSGIGWAAAEKFARNGWVVYAAARRVERMKPLAEMGIKTLALDVTDEKSCKKCVKKVLDETGRIDVLVNNAGYGACGPVEMVSETEARAQMDVNVYGLMRMCKLVIPQMRQQKAGRIINISSVGGRVSTYFGGWYHASKFAVEALSDAMRMELGRFGIKVILIEPGPIASNWGMIAAENIEKAGKDKAYQRACKRAAEAYRTLYEDNADNLPQPEAVAEKIYQAATKEKVKARYLVGWMAKGLILAKAVLSTRKFDQLMKEMYG